MYMPVHRHNKLVLYTCTTSSYGIQSTYLDSKIAWRSSEENNCI